MTMENTALSKAFPGMNRQFARLGLKQHPSLCTIWFKVWDAKVWIGISD